MGAAGVKVTQEHAVLEQLREGPVWAGNIVSKGGLRELKKAGRVRYDEGARDHYDGTLGAYVLKEH